MRLAPPSPRPLPPAGEGITCRACARLHCLMIVAKRQKRQETRALDRLRQLALVTCLGPGDAARHDLAGFADVLAQRVQILVIDLDDAFSGEAAELLAAEKFRHGLAPGRFGVGDNARRAR